MGDVRVRDNFIPLTKDDLIHLVCGDAGLAEADKAQFLHLCRVLVAILHLEYHRRLAELKEAYAPFDPESETRQLARLSPEEKQRKSNELANEIAWLMEKANYKHLCRDEIEPALAGASEWGMLMDVDFRIFERLVIFARGEAVETRQRRRWRKRWRKVDVEVPIYERLVMVIRLKPQYRLGRYADPDDVYLQIFKNIPRLDIKMLLPGAKVRFNTVDRSKVGFPILTGIVLFVYKAFIAFVDFLPRLIGDLLNLNPMALWTVGAGSVGYGIRSYYGYVQLKQKYSLSLTEILYFQNLDTNTGVLLRILDEAEQQEIREVILAYFFLWRHAGTAGWTWGEWKSAIEQFLADKADTRVNFDLRDAMARLEQFGMVRQAGDRFQARPLPEVMEDLQSRWGALWNGAEADARNRARGGSDGGKTQMRVAAPVAPAPGPDRSPQAR